MAIKLITIAVPTSGVKITTDTIVVQNEFVNGQAVTYTANGTVLGGLVNGGTYYVGNATVSGFRLYDTQNNALVGGLTGLKNLTGSGNNSQTFSSVVDYNKVVEIGNVVNDGLGDDLRTAFEKVNFAFRDLKESISNSAANVGTGIGIFRRKNGDTLEFKRITAGAGIIMRDESDAGGITGTIKISTTPAFNSIQTDTENITSGVNPAISIKGAVAPGYPLPTFDHPFGYPAGTVKDIEVSAVGPNISVQTRLPVSEILTTFDFGPLDGKYINAVQLCLAASNIDFGTINQPGTINLDCGGIVV